MLKMMGAAGVLQWGKSSKRNVICRRAEIGASDSFRWNRRRKFNTDEPGLFHAVTTKQKELHFVHRGGDPPENDERIAANPWINRLRLQTFERSKKKSWRRRRIKGRVVCSPEFGDCGGGMGAWLFFSGFELRQFGDGDGSVRLITERLDGVQLVKFLVATETCL
ncbi:hypothetical protein ACFX2A_031709 [Malus domestica]